MDEIQNQTTTTAQRPPTAQPSTMPERAQPETTLQSALQVLVDRAIDRADTLAANSEYLWDRLHNPPRVLSIDELAHITRVIEQCDKMTCAAIDLIEGRATFDAK
jgi:hypothetical protein